MSKDNREIQRRLAKLDALEAGGVDNWSNYDNALAQWRETIGREEIVENIIRDIFEAIQDCIEEPAGRGCGYGIRSEGYDIAADILLERYGELK